MSKEHSVVLDPKRKFGQPIVDPSSIPTQLLAMTVQAEDKNYERVADWYFIPIKIVKSAYEYETSVISRLAA